MMGAGPGNAKQDARCKKDTRKIRSTPGMPSKIKKDARKIKPSPPGVSKRTVPV
jgi:hypothetical protein